MNTKEIDLFLTPTVLAERLGVTVQTIYRHLKELNINAIHEKGRYKLYPPEMRMFLEAKNLPIPKETIACHIVKGGVGKTTLVHGLGSRASAYSFRVLLIDLDQQANLTTSFGVDAKPKQKFTLMDVLDTLNNNRETPVRIEDVIVKITDYLHIIPSNLQLANMDAKLIQGNESLGELFKTILKPVRENYDLVFFDCPPSLTRVTVAAHYYADRIIMPIIPDKWALDGLETTFDHINLLKRKYAINPNLGIVVNMCDYRQTILNSAVIEDLKNHPVYRNHIMGFIGISKQVGNCIAAGKNLWSAGMAKYQAIQDMDKLFQEMFNISNWKNIQPAAATKEEVKALM